MTVTFDTELLEVMPDTLSWKRYTGKDGAGNPTYDNGVDVRCNKVVTKSRGSTGDTQATFGPEIRMSGTVYAAPQVPKIGPRDMFVDVDDGAVGYVQAETTYRDVPDGGDYIQEVQLTEEQ